MGVTGRILPPNTDFEHARVWFTWFHVIWHTRHTDNIYHAKSRLNTPVWGSLRSPNYYEDIARISRSCLSAEMDFHCLAGPRNFSINLKYDVLCFWVFVYSIPAWVEISNGLNFELEGGKPHVTTLHRECYHAVWFYWWWRNRKNFLFCRMAEIDFQRLAGPRNVSVDLKYDVLC